MRPDIAYNINNVNTPRHDSISTKIHYDVLPLFSQIVNGAAPTYPTMWRTTNDKRWRWSRVNANGLSARHFPTHQIKCVCVCVRMLCGLYGRFTDRIVFGVWCVQYTTWQMTLCVLLTFGNGANKCRCHCCYPYRYIPYISLASLPVARSNQ